MGEMLMRVSGAMMVNVSGDGETWPVPATFTDAVPAPAIRAAGTVAVSCPEFTKDVVSADPFHVIDVAAVYPDPFAVRVKAAPPATVELGIILVSVSG